MKKIFILIFVLITFTRLSFAGAISTEVKSTVVFIYVKATNGELVANGTGFFVGTPEPLDKERTRTYLVTAKHVLQQENSKAFSPVIYVRINRKDGDAVTIPMNIKTEGVGKNVFFHDDSSVDLAVIPAWPPNADVDLKAIDYSFITTEADFKQLNIREGCDVFFTGLFTHHIGEHKNYPIVRFGKVALISDEKIDWDGIKTDLYLIESFSYGGNSGAPVFFSVEPNIPAGTILLNATPVLKLAGVMKGSFNEGQLLRVVETKKSPVSVSNIGIAAVVPAYKLYQILLKEGFLVK